MIMAYGPGPTGPGPTGSEPPGGPAKACPCYRFPIPTVPGGILNAPWGYVPCPVHAAEWAEWFARLKEVVREGVDG